MASMVLETENEVIDALREKYSSDDGWVFLPKVANATGYVKNRRTLDVIMMNTWPSRGLEIHGIEVKVSRSDWLRELKNPNKAEPVAKYCDRFWVAAGSRDVVDEDELPKGWGLLQPRGQKLVRAVQAPPLDPHPMDRTFLASLLRQVHKQTPQTQIENARAEGYSRGRGEGYKNGVESGRRNAKREIEHLEQKVERLKNIIDEFEEVSGIQLTQWNRGKIADAVNLLLKSTNAHRSALTRLLDGRNKIMESLEWIDRHLARMEMPEDVRKKLPEEITELIEA